MLTATYTLVALSVEQASVRISLLSFQHHVQATLRQQSSLTLAQLQTACEHLERLYQSCHWRKIDMYLIPALRQVTGRADRLLDELSLLNRAALQQVQALRQRAASVAAHVGDQVQQICAGIDDFCALLLQRLDKEERELFAIARSVIGGEAWFAIANQFLAHDAREEERRRCRTPLTALAPRVSQVAPAAPPVVAVFADIADIADIAVVAVVPIVLAAPAAPATRQPAPFNPGRRQAIAAGQPDYLI